MHQKAHIINTEVKPEFTDITDEDDFGVGGNMLCEERPLVFRRQELMLAG